MPPHCTKHINYHYNIEDYQDKVKKVDEIRGQLKLI